MGGPMSNSVTCLSACITGMYTRASVHACTCSLHCVFACVRVPPPAQGLAVTRRVAQPSPAIPQTSLLHSTSALCCPPTSPRAMCHLGPQSWANSCLEGNGIPL